MHSKTMANTTPQTMGANINNQPTTTGPPHMQLELKKTLDVVLGVCHFVCRKGCVQMEQMDFIFCKIIWEIIH